MSIVESNQVEGTIRVLPGSSFQVEAAWALELAELQSPEALERAKKLAEAASKYQRMTIAWQGAYASFKDIVYHIKMSSATETYIYYQSDAALHYAGGLEEVIANYERIPLLRAAYGLPCPFAEGTVYDIEIVDILYDSDNELSTNLTDECILSVTGVISKGVVSGLVPFPIVSDFTVAKIW